MNSPERINIDWNAADGFSALRQLDLPIEDAKAPSAEHLHMAIAQQRGRLFRLLGYVADCNAVDVSLRVIAATDDTLIVKNDGQLSFEGEYVVALEPPPSVGVHGDYRFDLLKFS